MNLGRDRNHFAHHFFTHPPFRHHHLRWWQWVHKQIALLYRRLNSSSELRDPHKRGNVYI